jgi:hypothetical protein
MRSVDHVKKRQIYIQEAKTQPSLPVVAMRRSKKLRESLLCEMFSSVFIIFWYTRVTLIGFLTQSLGRIVTQYLLVMWISQVLISGHSEGSETTLSISTNAWIGGCTNSMVTLSST